MIIIMMIMNVANLIYGCEVGHLVLDVGWGRGRTLQVGGAFLNN